MKSTEADISFKNFLSLFKDVIFTKRIVKKIVLLDTIMTIISIFSMVTWILGLMSKSIQHTVGRYNLKIYKLFIMK